MASEVARRCATALEARWSVAQAPADAQAAADLTGDWLASASQLVQAHGGLVWAATASQLRAHFGVESGPDDHAERGLRCGLALLALAHEQTELVRRRWPQVQAQLGVGVHSGPWAQERGADALAGPVAQLAAVIALAAPPGRLRLSLDVVARVRGRFDFEPPLPLAVEGVELPVQTCLLRRANEQAQVVGLHGGGDERRPLLGRQGELQLLQAAFTRVIDQRKLGVVTLLAEPGIGKSRLLREFDDWAHAQPLALHALRARAMPHTQDQAFGLFASLLRSFCQIDDDADTDAARLRFEQTIVPWFLPDTDIALAESHAHALGHLTGLELTDSHHLQAVAIAPQQVRQAGFAAAAQLLRRLSANGRAPLMLLIEDLHWADSDTLNFLDHLLDVNHDVALLIVSTSRPNLAERRPAWARTAGVHLCVDLGPLGPAGARQLATALLEKLPTIPPILVDRVVDGSQGNPFCIEERIKLLIDQGVIQTIIGSWTVNMVALRASRLPDSLTGVLKARLNLLPASERLVLQQASVIGPVFLEGTLQALGAGAARAMRGLMQRELTLSHGVPGDAGAGSLVRFSFKHPLLQQMTYETVPQLARRTLHGKLARWLLTLSGMQAKDALGLSAHHFEQAGDAAQAAAQHTRAAEHAASRFAIDAMTSHVQRGLALLDRLPASPAHHALRWRLLRVRVSMIEHLGQHVQYLVDIDRLAELAELLDDDTKRAQAAQSRSQLAMLTADYATMKTAARQALACAARAGEHRLRLGALRTLALAHCYAGDWDAGHRLVRQCLAQAREHGFSRIEAACMNTMAMVAQQQQDPLACLRWHEKELPLRRALGDRRAEAIALTNLGDGWLELGELVLGRRYCEEGLRLALALGHRFSECGTLCNLSKLERWLGNASEAARLARSALEAALAVGVPQLQQLALKRLGDAEWVAGCTSAAAQAFERAQALERSLSLPRQADAAAGLARLALSQDDLAAALQQVQRIHDREAASGASLDAESPRRVELVCHLVLERAGDPRAAAWLERAHRQLLATAASISDETLRAGFVNNIPDHRAILAAWSVHRAEAGAESTGHLA